MYEWFWFGIPASYSIKRFQLLTDMQLSGVICRDGHLGMLNPEGIRS